MTSQLLISTSASSSSSAPSPLEPGEPASSSPAISEARNRLMESMKKSAYQVDHQVRVLTLQAEADALLQQLQVLKRQRLAPELTSTHRS